MNIKKILSSVSVSVAVLVTGITASAFDTSVKPVAPQPDDICGYVRIIPSMERDTYVSIYKYTPEFPEEGYPVYDSVIEYDSFHSTESFVFNLEYNNYSFENEAYEGNYLIKIGVPVHGRSKEEPVYYTQSFLIEDTAYTGSTYEHTYRINLTEEELSEPTAVTEGNVTDLTFTAIDYILGDANNDGALNVRDASFIAMKLANQLKDELPAHADYNSDGDINVRDASAIASYLANLMSKPTEPSTEPATEPSEEETTEEITEAVTSTSPSTQITETTTAITTVYEVTQESETWVTDVTEKEN